MKKEFRERELPMDSILESSNEIDLTYSHKIMGLWERGTLYNRTNK